MTAITASAARARGFARVVLVGVAAVLAALVAFDQPVRGASTTIVISQFRVRGPNGGSDEFVELYNVSAAPVAIGGWRVNGSNSTGGTSTRATILAGTVLEPGCHYLLTNAATSGGPYSGSVPGDQTYATGITDDGGIALLTASSVVVDQVGMSAGSAYGEGTRLAPLLSLNQNRGYERRPGGTLGSGIDTDSNAADFQLLVPSDPQNASSPCIGASGLNAIGTATPSTAGVGGAVVLTVEVRLGADPAPAGTAVVADLTGIGGLNDQAFRDDGAEGDLEAGDSTFTFVAVVSASTTPGWCAKSLPVLAADLEGRTANTEIALTVSHPPLPIHAIQGPGTTSPYAGQTVTTRGVVTARRTVGFFIQTPDEEADADALTSEGIFVFTPSAATVGAYVEVTGRVAEFAPAGAGTPAITEITDATVSDVTTSSPPVPAPVTLTVDDLPTGGSEEQLERLEGMRVVVPALLVVAPTDGSANEAAGTVSSNGVFYGVVAGASRPFREAGIPVSSPLPAGAPVTVPRFDDNPERLRIDSDGQVGVLPVDVRAGTVLNGVRGVLDFAFRTWSILPDPGVLAGGAVAAAIPIEMAGDNEFAVGSFNLERFYDTVNAAGVSDVALDPATFSKRLVKASLAIRQIMRSPEIIGVQEVENLATLEALAAQLNADGGLPAPGYVAHLAEGNDVGGIDVGFLAREDRVTVVDVTQVGKDEPFAEPGGGTSLLNDRPPLVMRANVHGPTGTLPVTVIVNHLRSLSGIDDPAGGDRVRAKRRAQAEFLANLIQQRQQADPAERILSLGDYNAFEVNDGYVDVMGTVRGAPAAPAAVTLASEDLVGPDLTDLLDTLPAAERYSYVFDGNAQVLDHILVNEAARPRVTRFQYARSNADYPESLRYDDTRPERVSDHDMPVAHLAFPGVPVLTLQGPNPMTVECCSTFTDPGATATDDDFGDISGWITTSGSVDASSVGTYTITYRVTNGYATATADRTVHVVDTTAPLLLLNGSASMTVELGTAFQDPGFSASDTCAGDLTSWVLIGGTVDTGQVGTYTLTYTVSDGYNTTAATRTVRVIDTTPPVMSPVTATPAVLWPPNHQLVQAALVYTVTDNSGAASCAAAVTSNEPVNGTGDGDTSPDWLVIGAASVGLRAERAGTGNGREYLVTVTCRDASGNTASAAARVLVPKSAAGK